MKILMWLKNKVWWILGGLVLVLGAVFAVKYEREKLRIHENKKQAAKHLGAAEGLRDYADTYADEDIELVERERQIDKAVSDLDAKMKEVERNVGKRDAKTVADRFNNLATRWTDYE